MPTFTSPLAAPYRQGDGFGARGGEHKGDDLQIPVGTPVLAAQSGTVTAAGLNGTYGNSIVIDGGDGWATEYAHMESINVHVGDQVSQGQQIALSGGLKGLPTSGDSTGPHLHFEIRHNGVKINPAPYIPAAGQPGGTPTVNDTPNPGLLANLNNTLTTLNSPTTWVRIGYGVLGAVLLGIAAVRLFNSTPTGAAITQQVGNVAKAAAETAVIIPK